MIIEEVSDDMRRELDETFFVDVIHHIIDFLRGCLRCFYGDTSFECLHPDIEVTGEFWI